MKSHRAFPPGRGNLKIPVASRRTAHAGLALYSPCRPKGRFARWVAWRAVDLLGAKALPGKPTEWHPPMGEKIWMALASVWQDRVGPFEEMAVFDRAQASRAGLAALLLQGGRSVGFVKVREGDQASLANEFRAIEAIGNAGPALVEVPAPLALDTVEGWHFLLTSALRPSLHRMPSRPPLDVIVDQIRRGLEDLPRPAGVPQHWQPMHGDFTPWNLRQRSDGSLFLIDWEDAAWGPPGSDEVYYRAVESILLGRAFQTAEDYDEAKRFWQASLEERKVEAQAAGDYDVGLVGELLQAIGG